MQFLIKVQNIKGYLQMKKSIVFFIAILSFAIVGNSQYETMLPIPGAKMYFSDKPFTNNHEGAKTSSKSSDFIYGRIELQNNQTLLDAFKMSSIKTQYYYLRFWVQAYKNGEKTGNRNSFEYLLIKNEEDVKRNYLNFDILPNPTAASSSLCGLEEFTSAIATGPLYSIVNPSTFPEDGEYTIETRLFLQALDGWGKPLSEEKWPEVIDEFKFQFDTKDVAILRKNDEAATDLIQKNTFRLSKLPDYFSKSTTLSDPALSNSNISAVLKRDLPSANMKLIKFAVGDYTGPLWRIEKNDLGLIIRRHVTPIVNIVYQFQDDCYVGTANLWQEYIGGGKYGGLVVGERTCNSCGQKIDCVKVK